MRTTLTIDDDVAAKLQAAMRARRRPLRTVVNDALRAGLAVLDRRAPARKRHRTTGFNLGPSLAGSLDDIEEVLSRVEGEPHA